MLHAVLPACMDGNQILQINIGLKYLLNKTFGGRPITKARRVILMYFDDKYFFML